MTARKIDKSLAFCPPDWDVADAKAIQQLAAGEADADQQKRALSWIINMACATYDQPFRPGKDGQTEFACGRQFAGQQIVKLVKVDLLALQQNQTRRSKQ